MQRSHHWSRKANLQPLVIHIEMETKCYIFFLQFSIGSTQLELNKVITKEQTKVEFIHFIWLAKLLRNQIMTLWWSCYIYSFLIRQYKKEKKNKSAHANASIQKGGVWWKLSRAYIVVLSILNGFHLVLNIIFILCVPFSRWSTYINLILFISLQLHNK